MKKLFLDFQRIRLKHLEACVAQHNSVEIIGPAMAEIEAIREFLAKHEEGA